MKRDRGQEGEPASWPRATPPGWGSNMWRASPTWPSPGALRTLGTSGVLAEHAGAGAPPSLLPATGCGAVVCVSEANRQPPALPSRGQRAAWGPAVSDMSCWPRGFPSDRPGEEGPEEGLPATVLPSGSAGEAGLPRTERTPCGWERQDILSSAWGNSALPWRWGGCRLRPWHLCTQQEACSN